MRMEMPNPAIAPLLPFPFLFPAEEQPEDYTEVSHALPPTRGDCQAGSRPCPLISCRWHLAWEVRRIKRLITSDAEPDFVAQVISEMKHTCAMDLSESEHNIAVIGQALGCSHQRIDQICQNAVRKMRSRMKDLDL